MIDGPKPKNMFTKEQLEEMKEMSKNADRHFLDTSKMEEENNK